MDLSSSLQLPSIIVFKGGWYLCLLVSYHCGLFLICLMVDVKSSSWILFHFKMLTLKVIPQRDRQASHPLKGEGSLPFWQWHVHVTDRSCWAIGDWKLFTGREVIFTVVQQSCVWTETPTHATTYQKSQFIFLHEICHEIT